MDQFVFIRVGDESCETTVTGVETDGLTEEFVDLQPNSQHLIPYKAVASFVNDSGTINLI